MKYQTYFQGKIRKILSICRLLNILKHFGYKVDEDPPYAWQGKFFVQLLVKSKRVVVRTVL